jgi:hypothetical protein
MPNGFQKSFFSQTDSRKAGGDLGSEKLTYSTNQVILMEIIFNLFLIFLILNNWFFLKKITNHLLFTVVLKMPLSLMNHNKR